ncbi:MAG: DUF3570 domain-containing protein [Krumholzibacteria bacterium]|nr:DUF3570 domain-containing protein [Candidatus Krumholzibacteria bacterium]
MTTRRGIRLPVTLACGLAAAAVPSARAGDTTTGYVLNYYSDVDGVSVFTHYLDVGLDPWRDVAVLLHYVHDTVIIPGIDARPGSPEAVDAITTASRPIATESEAYEDFVKQRDALQGGVTWKNTGLSYYVSSESDYFAQMVTLSYARDFLGDNLNLAAGLSYSWDEIRPLADADTEGSGDHRRTLHGNLVATCVLTPRTIARLGAEFNRVEGQQHDPYRNVYAGGTNVSENHPRERLRRDLFARLSRYLGNRSSLVGDLRWYGDDWGVSSQTWGLRLHQYVSDEVVVRYRYRFYNQGAADFHRETYATTAGVDGHLTGDYRLGSFNAHLFGAQVAWRPRRAPLLGGTVRAPELMVSYERYFNSNNFTANVFETGVQVSF